LETFARATPFAGTALHCIEQRQDFGRAHPRWQA
jgi:hypothetical protein